MGEPVWSKITPNGKPFDYEDPALTPLKEENVKLKEKISILEKENNQLRELLEDSTQPETSDEVLD